MTFLYGAGRHITDNDRAETAASRQRDLREFFPRRPAGQTYDFGGEEEKDNYEIIGLAETSSTNRSWWSMVGVYVPLTQEPWYSMSMWCARGRPLQLAGACSEGSAIDKDQRSTTCGHGRWSRTLAPATRGMGLLASSAHRVVLAYAASTR